MEITTLSKNDFDSISRNLNDVQKNLRYASEQLAQAAQRNRVSLQQLRESMATNRAQPLLPQSLEQLQESLKFIFIEDNGEILITHQPPEL